MLAVGDFLGSGDDGVSFHGVEKPTILVHLCAGCLQ